MRLSSRWGRTITVGRVVVGLLVTTVALGSLLAPSAGAKIIYDKVVHKKFGIVPAPAQVLNSLTPIRGVGPIGAAGAPTCDPSIDPQCASPLQYNGGSVVHGEQDYLFFWAPPSFQTSQWTAYVAGMKQWLNDVVSQDFTAGDPLSVTQQYYDNSGAGGTKRYIPFAVQNAGSLMDTNPYPAGQCTEPTDPGDPIKVCLTDAQLANELTNYVTQNGLPTGLNVEYFILTPQGVGSCDDNTSKSCAYSQYCGYHTGTYTPSNQEIIYSNLPWGYQTGCDTNASLGGYPNSNFVDPVVGTFTHELAETMTDPNGDGWLGSGGGTDEIGDKCAYQYVVGGPSFDVTGLGTPPHNVTFGSDNYLIQLLFDNRVGGCALTDTDTQPGASISVPSGVSPGTPAAFSLANVTGVGIDYVDWSFGDGGTTESTGTNAVSHTYQTAGTYAVTAVITDNHGNEVKKTANVQIGGGGGLASPTLSMSAPTSGTAGSAISGLSLSSVLSGGASPTGTITYTVFGPQSTPPSNCSSGGSTVGTASPSGNGTYNPSSGFTPASAGDYWWYASYGGDAGNNPAASPCGTGMAETVVASGGGGTAALAVSVSPKRLAPRHAYSVTVIGNALSGGVFGQNESDVELYYGFGSCAPTWAGEKFKAAARKAADIGHWLVAPGTFAFTLHRTATASRFATVRFCGYVSRTTSLTDAHGSAYYTTT